MMTIQRRMLYAAVMLLSVPVSVAAAGEREREVVKPTTDFSRAEDYEAMQGGAATSRKKFNGDSFSNSSANLTLAQELDFKVGNGFFRRMWVQAPASTQSADGLGPLFNARACQRCHLKDGRGHPPDPSIAEEEAVSMFLRISVPPKTDAEKKAIAEHRINVVPEPMYGGQLQDFAIPGIDPEGQMHIDYAPVTVTLGDGSKVELRKPTYKVTDLKYGPMAPDVMLSPRVTPQMIGLGLIEMIDEADILAHADPDDKDGDGISGRPNIVWDVERNAPTIGRFGWKAGNPTIRQQSADAFLGDIGISSPMHPDGWGECMEGQKACRAAPHGGSQNQGGFEADEKVLGLVTHYSRNLAVPKRRRVSSSKVLAGKKIFYESGCISCHVPKFVTRTDPERPEHSHQLIWPYSDVLLHDMGDGLADNRPEGVADGREWRTAPLWGIGLTEMVSGHTFFLHDGRARNLLEAILWHGGEAEKSKEVVRQLSKKDRDALIAFLESL